MNNYSQNTCTIGKLLLTLQPNYYKDMAVVNIDYANRVNRSLGQGIILVWKDKPETDASRYEIFKRASLIFEKYNGETDLGVSRGSLNNHFSKNKTSEPVQYENSKVKIIRTRLYELKDLKSTSKG